jgi:hypothetical protein
MTSDLLGTFEDDWNFAWDRHISPRHGSKARALRFQASDGKPRTFFTIGPLQVRNYAESLLKQFAENDTGGISHYWDEVKDQDNSPTKHLILESPKLKRDIGRSAKINEQHTICERIRVALGLGDEGFWIASCYPIP